MHGGSFLSFFAVVWRKSKIMHPIIRFKDFRGGILSKKISLVLLELLIDILLERRTGHVNRPEDLAKDGKRKDQSNT